MDCIRVGMINTKDNKINHNGGLGKMELITLN